MNAPGVNTSQAPGVTIWDIGTKKETSKFFFYENGRHRALIFATPCGSLPRFHLMPAGQN